MKNERIQILNGIALVVIVTITAIILALAFLEKKYVYFLDYYYDENLYSFNITEDYNLKIDIKLICNDEKCIGDTNRVISTSNQAKKEDVKKLVNIFKLEQNKKIETNYDEINDNQRKAINMILN